MPASELTADHVSQASGWKVPHDRVVNAHATTPGDPSWLLSVSVYGSSQLTNWFVRQWAETRRASPLAIAIVQNESTRVL